MAAVSEEGPLTTRLGEGGRTPTGRGIPRGDGSLRSPHPGSSPRTLNAPHGIGARPSPPSRRAVAVGPLRRVSAATSSRRGAFPRAPGAAGNAVKHLALHHEPRHSIAGASIPRSNRVPTRTRTRERSLVREYSRMSPVLRWPESLDCGLSLADAVPRRIGDTLPRTASQRRMNAHTRPRPHRPRSQ